MDEDESREYSEDDIFDMDDITFKPNTFNSKNKQQSKPAPQKPPPQQKEQSKKATFVIEGDKKTSKSAKVPSNSLNLMSEFKTVQPSALEHLKISELKPNRAASKSPARMTPNSSFHQLSAIDIALNSSPTHK